MFQTVKQSYYLRQFVLEMSTQSFVVKTCTRHKHSALKPVNAVKGFPTTTITTVYDSFTVYHTCMLVVSQQHASDQRLLINCLDNIDLHRRPRRFVKLSSRGWLLFAVI